MRRLTQSVARHAVVGVRKQAQASLSAQAITVRMAMLRAWPHSCSAEPAACWPP